MIERAITAGVPFRWVAADSVYGVGDIEMSLRRAGRCYVLGVNANSQFRSWLGKPLVAGTTETIAGPSIPHAGIAYQPAKAPKAPGYTIGLTAS